MNLEDMFKFLNEIGKSDILIDDVGNAYMFFINVKEKGY